MSEKKISGDAYVPGDTEQFEQNATAFKKPPQRSVSITEGVKAQFKKNSEDFSVLMRRMSSYVQFHLQNNTKEASDAGVGPNMLAIEAYANLRVTMAQMQTLVEDLQSNRPLRSNLENKKRVNEILTEYFNEWEEGYGIRITEEGVSIQRQESAPEENSSSGETGGEASDKIDDGHRAKNQDN